MYQLFISYTHLDRHIAEGIRNVLNDAYEGMITTYLAGQDLLTGMEWKTEIKNNLETCDAILSIMTETSINKPWLFIEWSAFWMMDKTFFVLVTEEVKVSDLVHPMQDRQLTRMQDSDSVKLFLRALQKKSGYRMVPFAFVDTFIEAVEAGIRKKQEEEYEKYTENWELLPESDGEKRKLALYFYRKHEYEYFSEVISRIISNTTKVYIAREVIRQADFATLRSVISEIDNATGLERIAYKLIEEGYPEAKELRTILDTLSNRSQTALTRFLIHLVQLDLYEEDIFSYALQQQRSMVEVRKLAIYLVHNSKLDNKLFIKLIERLSNLNRNELRTVLIEMFDQNYGWSSHFEEAFSKLAEKNQEQALIVLEHIRNKDKKLYNTLYAKYIDGKSSMK